MESFNSSSFPVLMNREGEGEDAVFSLKEGLDNKLLDTALEFQPDWEVETLSAPEFLSVVCAGQNFPYSKTCHHKILSQFLLQTTYSALWPAAKLSLYVFLSSRVSVFSINNIE